MVFSKLIVIHLGVVMIVLHTSHAKEDIQIVAFQDSEITQHVNFTILTPERKECASVIN